MHIERLCVEEGRDLRTKLWGTPTFRNKGEEEGPAKECPVRKETNQKRVTPGSKEGCALRQRSDGTVVAAATAENWIQNQGVISDL